MSRNESTLLRYNKAKALISEGLNIDTACKQAKIGNVTYYKFKKLETKPVKKTPRKLLNIQDLPTFSPAIGKPFMVFGSPNQLAEFAKGMS